MHQVTGESPGNTVRPASWPARLVPAVGVSLAAACLLVLTVRGWSNAVLFIGALACLVLLKWGRLAPLAAGEQGVAKGVSLMLAAPLLAVMLSAAVRGDGYAGQFDAPMRFAFAIPIFLFALRARVDPSRSLRWILPAALLFLLVARLVQGQPARWPAERMTTGFVDPLVFGYISLTFGLMAMFTIPEKGEPGRRMFLALALAALLLGAFFSVRSASRTGWLAVPMLAALWLHLHWTRASRWSLASTIVGACAIVLAAFMLVPTVHARVLEAIGELLHYPWSSVPPDTPVSLRITYLRIAADMVALHPWSGVGLTPLLMPGSLPPLDYASPVAIQAAMKSGFHNQVVSSAVRFGIGGLITSAALLVVPLVICLRALGSASPATRRNAAVGAAFFTCVLVASFTTEVFDLKFMASFYAVMTAVFCGAALASRDERDERAGEPAN